MWSRSSLNLRKILSRKWWRWKKRRAISKTLNKNSRPLLRIAQQIDEIVIIYIVSKSILIVLLLLMWTLVLNLLKHILGLFLFIIDFLLQNIEPKQTIYFLENFLSFYAYFLVFNFWKAVNIFLFLMIDHIPNYLLSTASRKQTEIQFKTNQ